jgi:hypothetical protein
MLHTGNKFFKKIELKNNEVEETISLKKTIENNITIPCNYIKVEPLTSWNEAFNPSIFFIKLLGEDQDKKYISKTIKEYNNFNEDQVMKLCLKFIRKSNYYEIFENLLEKCKCKFEEPILTKFHKEFVMNGNFEKYLIKTKKRCENIIENLSKENIFENFILGSKYEYEWINLNKMIEKNENNSFPIKRSGHQLCNFYI